MSFSVKVKSEILRLQSERTEKISLLSSYIRNNAVITENSILINTENMEISKYIFELFKELYNIFPIITVRKSFNFKKSMSYLLKLDSHLSLILKDLSLINEDGYFINIPREYIYTEDDDKMSYLRGVFLATGSINDPKTSRYHLEFLIDDYDYSLFVCELLDYFNLNSKLIERNNGFMIYIKEAEKISDFLRIMKAYNAVLYFEDIKAYREHKNLVNRLNNCEQANVDKIFMTSSKQIKDIEKLKEYDMIDLLDERLQELIKYRLEYPESSLQELSDIISLETGVKITKSGLNHRFRKIKEIVSNLEKKENEK